jgi:septation ring formation regulator EzrA
MKKEYEEKIAKILAESGEFFKSSEEVQNELERARQLINDAFNLLKEGKNNEANLQLENLRPLLKELNSHFKNYPSLFEERAKTVWENYFALELIIHFLKKDDFYWPNTIISLEPAQQLEGLIIFLEEIYELTPLFIKEHKYDKIIKIKEWATDFYSLSYAQKENTPYLNKKLMQIKKYIRQWEDLLLEK